VFSTKKIPFHPHFLSQMLRQDSPASLQAFSGCCMVVKPTLSRTGTSGISPWAFLPSQEVLRTKRIYSSILLAWDYHSLPRSSIFQEEQWRKNSWLVCKNR